MSQMPKTPARLVRLASLAGCLMALAACDKANPESLRVDADEFAVVANWNATAAPVGTSTVRATLTAKQHLGFHMETNVTITGTPNASYQWRIFRGDCATNTAAASNTSPTGLLVFATTQSYPDIVVSPSGTAALTRTIAGSLDSLKQYSVRVRVLTTGNWNGTNPIACGNLQRTGGS